MQMVYARHDRDPRGGPILAVGFQGDEPDPMPGDGDAVSTLVAAVHHVAASFAKRREALVAERAAAAERMAAAGRERDRIRSEIAAAEHSLFGDALTRRLAELGELLAAAEDDYGIHGRGREDARHALSALDTEARTAVAAAVECEGARLARERRTEMTKIGDAIAARIADQLAAYVAAKQNLGALTDPARRREATAALLEWAGIRPVAPLESMEQRFQ